MGKDPAFLFYPGDWITGTMHMKLEAKGAYMELLILQFERGSFTKEDAEHVLGMCFERAWPIVREKFKIKDGKYWNVRLRDEKEKRKKYSESRRNNAKGNKPTIKQPETHAKHMQKHMHPHMENENRNRNIVVNEDGNEVIKAIVALLNLRTGKHFKSTSKKTQALIRGRLREGFTPEDFQYVIEKKTIDWRDDAKMEKYLRPETLFGSKFEGYRNETKIETKNTTSMVLDEARKDGLID